MYQFWKASKIGFSRPGVRPPAWTPPGEAKESIVLRIRHIGQCYFKTILGLRHMDIKNTPIFDGRTSRTAQLSHLAKAQLSQNTVDAQVDVSSSQNCRTASCKSTAKRRRPKNDLAELAETSIKKWASSGTKHCKTQRAEHLGSNFTGEICKSTLKKSRKACPRQSAGWPNG